MQRNWTEMGAELVERIGGQDAASREADALEWQDVPIGGKVTVGFMPGEGIKAVIRELGIPKVSAVAVGAVERPPATGDEDGFYPGFYGIEGHYSNGRARVFVLDTGTFIQPLFSDFYPKDEDARTLAFRLRVAEAEDDDEATTLALNDVAAFLELPLDETERGLTPAAAERIDAFVEETLGAPVAG